MTAAATKVGEELARELLATGARRTEGPTSPNSTVGAKP